MQGEMNVESEVYEIRVRGVFFTCWDDWFDGMEVVRCDDGVTLLRGQVKDQPSLHGLLAKVRNLNLKLISVETVAAPQIIHEKERDSMTDRMLGKSGVKVSAIGMGCWAIGGPFWHEGWVGYGDVDDAESVRAIHAGLDMGVTFFDTSDAYGAGHSERILGKALSGRRSEVVIATKFGYVPDEENRRIVGENASPAYIRQACEASLQRLKTDYIDLYQFHIHDYDLNKASEVCDVLESLVENGKIRWYGWSTSSPDAVRVFSHGSHFVAAQFGMNLLRSDPGMLEICEEMGLAAILRGPLAMGILTGKFQSDSVFPGNDMRHRWGWNFSEGVLADYLKKVEALRSVLTQGGRTLAQGALGWVLARSSCTLPIPGFKTVKQVQENITALRLGPLNQEQMQAIECLLNPNQVD